ncbi:MAG: hypothetical protein FWF86_01025 [Clostridia bacterium]|nr:hypothetical protein [Clostridia bacterium]
MKPNNGVFNSPIIRAKKHRMVLTALCLIMSMTAGWLPAAHAEAPTITIVSADGQESPNARADFITRILALAKQKFDQANGKAQRAHYSGDIYVCKNFTVYLFRENCKQFRMAEFPDAPLVIPDNQKKEDCKPYVYGVEWKDVDPAQGNPFYAAASFRYNGSLSKEANRLLAREFLIQAQRGDYFQMAAKYYYGTGAHSMVFTADYDPVADAVRWTDSNMKGKRVNNERYGYVQYDAEREVDWFVDAFCRKGYGATLYRLRDDIVYAE